MEKKHGIFYNFFHNVPLVNAAPWLWKLLFYWLWIPAVALTCLLTYFNCPQGVHYTWSYIALTALVTFVIYPWILPLVLWFLNFWFYFCDAVKESLKEFYHALKDDLTVENPGETDFLCRLDEETLGTKTEPVSIEDDGRTESEHEDPVHDSEADKDEKDDATLVAVETDRTLKEGIRKYCSSILSDFFLQPQIETFCNDILLARSVEEIDDNVVAMLEVVDDRIKIGRRLSPTPKLQMHDWYTIIYNIRPMIGKKNREMFLLFKKMFPGVFRKTVESTFVTGISKSITRYSKDSDHLDVAVRNRFFQPLNDDTVNAIDEYLKGLAEQSHQSL